MVVVAATPSSSEVNAVVAKPATSLMASRAVAAVVSPASTFTVRVCVATLKLALAAPPEAALRKRIL